MLGAKTVTHMTKCIKHKMRKIVCAIEKGKSVVSIGSAVFKIRAEMCAKTAKGENPWVGADQC